MDISTLRKVGQYRSVFYEIAKSNGVYPWAYYVDLNLERFSDKALSHKVWNAKKYMQADFLDIPMHRGCSFTRHMLCYADTGKEIKEIRLVRFGCDYGHYGDEEGQTFNSVYDEVKETIDFIVETLYEVKEGLNHGE